MDLLEGDADVLEASQHLGRFLDDFYEHKPHPFGIGPPDAIGRSPRHRPAGSRMRQS
jgi:hypothetical protein